MKDDEDQDQCPGSHHGESTDKGRRDVLKVLGMAALEGMMGAIPPLAHAAGQPDTHLQTHLPPATCKLPPFKTHDGSVYVPNNATPPKINGATQPIWVGKGRPPKGTLAEAKWFQQQVANIRKDGPTFGPRKDEFLPYLLIRAATGDRGARPIDLF